jgi:ATP-dependent exoDNAse (exonuclease V) alpha subunit
MKVMITYNVETELDIANGARGTVERIIMDESESDGGSPAFSQHIRELPRPPLCVLVRLSKADVSWELPGLEKGLVPITPIRNCFHIKTPDGKSVALWREQLPLTPAYAFTDYRSQGQTLPYVLIDLATPPTGGLTQFNAYVALSRSQARDTARLLRSFDERLFTTPPDESLVQEDANLERLNELTRKSELICASFEPITNIQ